MASACVNNMGMSPENFLDCSPAGTVFPSYGWLSPRISFSREVMDDESSSKVNNGNGSASVKNTKQPQQQQKSTKHQKEEILLVSDQTQMADPDPDLSTGDFEFRLEDPVIMLPADELFYDGKLMPLQLSSVKAPVNDFSSPEIRTPETAKAVRTNEISGSDPYLFSPKAPRCSSRWRELLGFKKLYQNKSESQKTTMMTSSFSSSSSSASSTSINSKALKLFLHRSSKSSASSSSEASLSMPLMKDLDCESVSISSRLSLSSTSSGHDHEDLPRLSLDSDKPNTNPISLHRNPNPGQPRIRMVKPRQPSDTNLRSLIDNPTATRLGRSPMRSAQGESVGVASRGVSVDSPRMNSCGKIVFQSLERSSSSPSSFNGGPRFKHRGMERSYSANVRVTPVLNVPVCSLRGSSKSGSVFGFGPLFSSPQKRDTGGNGNAFSGNGGVGGGSNRIIQHGNSSRHRTDRAKILEINSNINKNNTVRGETERGLGNDAKIQTVNRGASSAELFFAPKAVVSGPHVTPHGEIEWEGRTETQITTIKATETMPFN